MKNNSTKQKVIDAASTLFSKKVFMGLLLEISQKVPPLMFL